MSEWITEQDWRWLDVASTIGNGRNARIVYTIRQLARLLRSRDRYIAELEQHINELVRSAAETQSELSDWQASARDAMRENPDEVHCSCVGPLRQRINELESTLASTSADLEMARDVLRMVYAQTKETAARYCVQRGVQIWLSNRLYELIKKRSQ